MHVIIWKDRLSAFQLDAQIFFMAYCLAPRIYKPSKNSDTVAGRDHHREGLSEAVVHLLIILNYDDRDSITLCFCPHYDIGRRDILHDCIRR